MKIVQITPGAGGMYCGGCLHDNALVTALRADGHDAIMVPLYLPSTLDEADQCAQTPIFFGGINVYLSQKSAWFRRAPDWLRQKLSSRRLLKWASGRAAKTRADQVGDLTLSMLRGEEGNQRRELEELVQWLRANHPPDVICLSNALLIGMARRLKQELRVPVVCLLQGEDSFLDALPETLRATAWQIVAERAAEVDRFIAPSQYYAKRMSERLRLPADRVRVVMNGIQLDGYPIPSATPSVSTTANTKPRVLGYFARMCRDKGLDTLVDAYIQLKQRPSFSDLRLHVGGSSGPADASFVEEQREKLRAAGVLDLVQFSPNVSRADKIQFLKALTVFSTPAMYGEAFGLYVIEAMAAGVPVVQPRHGAFPELVAATGGGILCEPGDARGLADAIGRVLDDPAHARGLGQRGQQAIHQNFTAAAMSRHYIEVFREITK